MIRPMLGVVGSPAASRRVIAPSRASADAPPQ
jgi:hypothetical protein